MRTCHCGRPSGNRAMCDAHRKRKQEGRTSKTPIRKYVRGSVEERLRSYSQRQGTCLIWRGQTNNHGYGKIMIDGSKQQVHRVAYEHWVGPIPDGYHVDHLCSIRACIEPSHLEPVTPRENTLRVGMRRDTTTGQFVARATDISRQSTRLHTRR